MLKKTILTAALGVAFSASGAFAATIWIDTFDAPGGSGQAVESQANAPGGLDADTLLGLAGVEGGSRTMEIATTNGPFAQERALLTAGTDSGRLGYSNDESVTSMARMLWDADGAGFGMGAGIDLTGAGTNNLLKLEDVISDLAISIVFTVEDAMGGSSVFAGMSELLLVPTDFLASFDEFMGDADFTKITSIELKLTATTIGSDLSANSLSAMQIPLPATAFLLLGAIGGLGLTRRKKS